MHPYRADDARAQIASLQQVRNERDAVAVARALQRVEADARTGVNLMPAIVAAVKFPAWQITTRLVGVRIPGAAALHHATNRSWR
jgi:methylmalonyl-CoA mutase N-terminal domain/subunit